MIMKTFLSREELTKLGIKTFGEDVHVSRNALIYQPELLEIEDHVRIDDFATISGHVRLKSYIHIAQFCSLYGGDQGIYLDDFSAISSKSIIYATSNDYSGESMTNPMVPNEFKPTDKNAAVHLKKHVVIGCMSVVLPGVTIGEGSAIGAMSLCTRDVAPWGVYAGIPAKRIKDRSKKLLEFEKELLARIGCPQGGILPSSVLAPQKGEAA